MIRYAADENLNHDIVRGLRRRRPAIDILTVQEAGLGGASDATVLEWAAAEGRILLTHDVATLMDRAYERIHRGLPMTGVCQVSRAQSMGAVIDDLLLIVDVSSAVEWADRVIFLPL